MLVPKVGSEPSVYAQTHSFQIHHRRGAGPSSGSAGVDPDPGAGDAACPDVLGVYTRVLILGKIIES